MKSLLTLKDQTLLKTFSVMVQREREVISELILHLAEIGRRRLYLREGYSSLYAYLIEKYHYSKSAAYRRIQAAKLAQRYSETVGYLRAAKLNLTTVSLIEPHATSKNSKELIEKMLGKSKEEVELLLLSHAPKPEKHFDKIRRLPVVKIVKREDDEQKVSKFTPAAGVNEMGENREQKGPGGTFRGAQGPFCTTVAKQEEIIRRVKIEFVADEKVAQKIKRAKEILRHKYPSGKLEDIIDLALSDMLEKRDPCRKLSSKLFRRKSAQSSSKPFQRKGAQSSSKLFRRKSAQSDSKPERKPLTRYIPQDVRREVYLRDNGQCVYQNPAGKICGERAFLQVDHVRPWALGGASTEENLRLLCAQHNQWRAETTFQ